MRTSPSTVLATAVLLASPLSDATAAESASQIRREMTRTEDQFYALYNQINTDRQYDMVCAKDQRTGTKFVNRVCQPRYLLTAKEQAASERMTSAVSASQSAGGAYDRGANVGTPVTDAAGGIAGAALAAKEEGFRKNLLEVMQKSPELQALGRKRDELNARLNAAGR